MAPQGEFLEHVKQNNPEQNRGEDRCACKLKHRMRNHAEESGAEQSADGVGDQAARNKTQLLSFQNEQQAGEPDRAD